MWENTAFILMILSYSLLAVILSLVSSERIRDNSNFEIVYICSKIITIKNMILNNHRSEIIYDFSSSGEASGLAMNYKNLLKLTGKKWLNRKL